MTTRTEEQKKKEAEERSDSENEAVIEKREGRGQSANITRGVMQERRRQEEEDRKRYGDPGEHH